ncbi:hypothetical protein LUZ63_014134 [Rhynchospora breviuscula]|uniref:F-box domain-containing protein n=1 Tax=Rhynchospora breviuscula TaxID=2022672 RepID=A0A9Q0C9U3_9POAL|nr:hypothetical protein LUZ63_014134 [Rhynchospora breviuscula]
MENNVTGTDKISDLTDDILTHILSYLSTREAVQTCIFSKRWRSTWASVPVLRFDYGNFVPEATKRMHKESMVKFVKFVRGVIQNREKSLSLDTFEFRWHAAHDPCHCADLFSSECILLALKFNPLAFSVCACRRVILDCIEPIFACSSLESISLECASLSSDDKFLNLTAVKLPHLKLLELHSANVDDNFFKMLFSGCPVLEELKLYSCILHASLLSSEVLTSLVLKRCSFQNKLVISTPNLVHIDIYHAQSDGVRLSMETMTSLRAARIQCLTVHVNDTVKCSKGLLNLHVSSTFGISAHTLKSDQRKKVTRKGFPNCSNFKNLKSLQLGCSDLNHMFNSVPLFLHKSPNLEKLSLQIFPKNIWLNMKEKSIEEEWRDAKSRYEKWRDALLQLKHLEVVEIVNCKERMEIVNKLVEELSSFLKSTEIKIVN